MAEKVKCNKWMDEHLALKNKMLARFTEIFKDLPEDCDVIQLEGEYGYCIYKQDDYSGEYVNYTPKHLIDGAIVADKEFDGEETEIELDDLELCEIATLLDFFEDKYTELKNNNKEVIEETENA